MSRRSQRAGALLAGAAALLLVAGPAFPATATGPSTTVSPYVLPVASGVDITSLLTVNDQPTTDGYHMVGVPDGLGAAGSKKGVTLTMNHELRDAQGIPRRHGQRGAFLSRYQINPATLEVTSGQDLLRPGTRYWNYPLHAYDGAPSPGQIAAFSRFCSSTLSDAGQFEGGKGGAGFGGRVYLTGEESGGEGRVFGVADDAPSTAYQLPRLGLASFENQVPAHNQSDTTLVMSNEDAGAADSELLAYVGTKAKKGNGLDRAGLTDGALNGVHVPGIANDAAFRAAHNVGDAVAFDLVGLDWDQSGAAQQTERTAKGVLGFNRAEDGHWDPSNPNDYYFVTTEGGEGTTGGGGGGLWRLRFADIENPAAGGTLTLLLDGTEPIGFNKPDNVAIDTHGNLLIQEDPGNVAAIARIAAYRISDGALGVVAQFNPAQFDPANSADPTFLTQDEETSGIIDTGSTFGAGTFLFDAQVHTAKGLPAGTGPGTVEEYVENGQLLLLKVADFSAVYSPSTTT